MRGPVLLGAWLALMTGLSGQPLLPTPTATPSAVTTPGPEAHEHEHDHEHEHEHEHEDPGHQHTTDCEHDHEVVPSAKDESRPALQGYLFRARTLERRGVAIPTIWAGARALWLLALLLVPVYLMRARRRASS